MRLRNRLARSAPHRLVVAGSRRTRAASLTAVVAVALTHVAVPSAVAQGLGPATPEVNGATRNAIRKVICGPTGQCKTCPTYTSGDEGFEITVGAIHLGAFVNPGAKEAYVTLYGCEPRPGNSVGSVLLRNRGGTWRFVRYDPAINVNVCQRFPYDGGTVVLVCNDSYFGQGYVIDRVYAIYTGPKETTTKTLLRVQTNEEACRPTVDSFVLAGWKQRDVNNDGRRDLVVTIDESHRPRGGGDECADPTGKARIERYDVALLFDGKRFAASKGSAATLACLDSDTLGEGVPGTYCPVPSS
jgi:hypothetical protein